MPVVTFCRWPHTTEMSSLKITNICWEEIGRRHYLQIDLSEFADYIVQIEAGEFNSHEINYQSEDYYSRWTTGYKITFISSETRLMFLLKYPNDSVIDPNQSTIVFLRD